MRHTLIDSLDKAIENIIRYRTEVDREPLLARRMTRPRAWYAVKSDDGEWLFGPSKFIGYARSSAKAYLSKASSVEHRGREAVLKEWFKVVRPETPLGVELAGALRNFLNSHGHSGPRRDAWICVQKQPFARGKGTVGLWVQNRIHVDPAICGGRPHIRGTRVRVSDVLDLLANGALPSDILADYPYLTEADLRAALAYGAAATEHRVILAA